MHHEQQGIGPCLLYRGPERHPHGQLKHAPGAGRGDNPWTFRLGLLVLTHVAGTANIVSVLAMAPVLTREFGLDATEFGFFITAHQVLTIALSLVVAVGLYALLNRTRIGTAMRASVDNPELLKLFGGQPERVAALSWAIGTSLAALAGVLLVSTIGLDYYALLLLVINAFAAAILGRLKNLPLTFVGAMSLGLLTSYASGYLPTEGLLNSVRNVVPALFLSVGFVISRMVPSFRAMQARIDEVNRVLREQIAGIRVVRAFVRERHETERFAVANEELTDVAVRAGRWMATMFPLAMLVVNVSSVFGLISVPTQSAYNAAKFGVRGFTDALYMELKVARHPVSATTVHPGGIKTNIVKNARLHESLGAAADLESTHGRFQSISMTSPEKAASAILTAVRRDRRRVTVGPDAKVIDLLSRLPAPLYQQALVLGARRELT